MAKVWIEFDAEGFDDEAAYLKDFEQDVIALIKQYNLHPKNIIINGEIYKKL